ncbi:hypothetical protein [Thermomonospora cellulosilytica]|uniref:Uncharacterized protein n=1 Tax=Thermomonospora cellulosilytica TaxID=1411118 RepID=A0A7W3R624_9ACTN|nr:hypothetical protein [Thermomonospora cellulosilytica]MBA9001157.1 hypothetical protein [Thermomonospora cellulosilytica]
MSDVRKGLAGALLAVATAMTVAAGPAAHAATTTAADHREPRGHGQSHNHDHPYGHGHGHGQGHGHPYGHGRVLRFRCHVPAHRWNDNCLRFTVPPRASVYVYNRRSGYRPVAFRIHRHKLILREGYRGRLFHNHGHHRITVDLAVRSARHAHRGYTSGVVYIKRH